MFILENILLFISLLLQRHKERWRWLLSLRVALLLLCVCLSAELKSPSQFQKVLHLSRFVWSYGIPVRKLERRGLQYSLHRDDQSENLKLDSNTHSSKNKKIRMVRRIVQNPDAIFCSLRSRFFNIHVLSPIVTQKRRKLIVAELQSSFSVWTIISPSSYLLEFDDKHWLHHSAPSPSLSLALSVVDGWLFLFARIRYAPCPFTAHFPNAK